MNLLTLQRKANIIWKQRGIQRVRKELGNGKGRSDVEIHERLGSFQSGVSASSSTSLRKNVNVSRRPGYGKAESGEMRRTRQRLGRN